MITGFKDLSYLEGCEVIWIRGYSDLTELDGCRIPERCKIIKDYGCTLLVEMIYEGWFEAGENTFRKLIPKAAMAVGDVVLKDRSRLVGNMVADYEVRSA